MTAGIRSQTVAGTKVALAPAAMAALLAGTLVAGAIAGIAGKSAVDFMATNDAAVTTSVDPALTVRAAQVVVGRGPLAADSGTGVSLPNVTRHPTEHGPLR